MSGTAALVGDGILNYESVRLRREALKVPNWKGGTIKVGQITDIHLDRDHALLKALNGIETLRAEKPDLVVFTGDFATFNLPESQARTKTFLKRLASLECPTASILGNHDVATGLDRFIVETGKKVGAPILVNEGLDLDGYMLVGMNDGGAAAPNIADPRFFPHSTLVLYHEPDYVVKQLKHVSLQISGHSHGGQICLPGGISVHTPPGARNYIDGFYPNAHIPLYVSSGIGTTGIPMRLFCPSEVNLLTISSA